MILAMNGAMNWGILQFRDPHVDFVGDRSREILGLPAPMLATWGPMCFAWAGPLDQPWISPETVLWLGRCQRAGMIAGFSVRGFT